MQTWWNWHCKRIYKIQKIFGNISRDCLWETWYIYPNNAFHDVTASILLNSTISFWVMFICCFFVFVFFSRFLYTRLPYASTSRNTRGNIWTNAPVLEVWSRSSTSFWWNQQGIKENLSDHLDLRIRYCYYATNWGLFLGNRLFNLKAFLECCLS